MAAIALANASMGDYKLKSSPDYEVSSTSVKKRDEPRLHPYSPGCMSFPPNCLNNVCLPNRVILRIFQLSCMRSSPPLFGLILLSVPIRTLQSCRQRQGAGRDAAERDEEAAGNGPAGGLAAHHAVEIQLPVLGPEVDQARNSGHSRGRQQALEGNRR